VKRMKSEKGLGRSWKRTVSRIVMLAVAATVAGVMLTWTERKGGTDETVDIVGPMVSLSKINSHRMRDQELYRESLEMDLRTLRVQLVQMSDSKTDVFFNRIDRLMERIDEVKHLPSEIY